MRFKLDGVTSFAAHCELDTDARDDDVEKDVENGRSSRMSRTPKGASGSPGEIWRWKLYPSGGQSLDEPVHSGNWSKAQRTASILAQKNMSLNVIQQALRHKRLSTTEQGTGAGPPSSGSDKASQNEKPARVVTLAG